MNVLMVRYGKKICSLFLTLFVALNLFAVTDISVGFVSSDTVLVVAEAAPDSGGSGGYMGGPSAGKLNGDGKQVDPTKDGKYQLGNSGILKSLEDVFANTATEGVTRLRPHILTLIGLFGIISFCTNWSLYEGQMRLSMIISTILKVGFFFWLAVNWVMIADAIYESLAKLGIVAAGMSAADYETFSDEMNGSAIIDRGFYAVKELWKGLGSSSKGLLGLTAEIVMRILALILILFAHFWIAFEVFMTRVEFRIFECLSFIFLPFGVFQATSFLFQRCVSGVFSYGAKLLVLSFLVSLVENAVYWQSGKDNSALNLTANSSAGDMILVAVSMLLIAYLVSKSGQLAAAMASGSPQLDGSGVRGMMRSATGGAAFLGASGVANYYKAKAGQASESSVSEAAGASESSGGGLVGNLAAAAGVVATGGAAAPALAAAGSSAAAGGAAAAAGSAAGSAVGAAAGGAAGGGGASTMLDAIKSQPSMKGEASKIGTKSDGYYAQMQESLAKTMQSGGMDAKTAASKAKDMTSIEKTKDSMADAYRNLTNQQESMVGGSGGEGGAGGEAGAGGAGGSGGAGGAGGKGPETASAAPEDKYATGNASKWLDEKKKLPGALLSKVTSPLSNMASEAKNVASEFASSHTPEGAKKAYNAAKDDINKASESANNVIDAAGRMYEQGQKRGIMSNLNEVFDGDAKGADRRRAAGAAVMAAGSKLGSAITPSATKRSILKGVAGDVGRHLLYKSAPFQIVHGAFNALMQDENVKVQWQKTDKNVDGIQNMSGDTTTVRAGERRIFRPDVPPKVF